MKTITLLLSMLITAATFAETSIEFIDTYRPKRGSFKLFRAPMSFDSDKITRAKPKNPDMEHIYRVDYVATSPKNHLSAYQRNLDHKRWKVLRSFLDLSEDVEFDKRIYYQTNREKKEELFHGFIVYYRPSAKAMHAASFTPMSDLVETIAGKTVNSRTRNIDIETAKWVDTTYVGNISIQRKNDMEREFLQRKLVVEWGYDSVGSDKKYHNAFYILSKVSPGLFMAFATLKDRSIFNMMTRNKITDKTLIVTDMTGSMYPYYSQLFVWHALKVAQGVKMKHVFFNDGDRKQTHEKVIGSTGGIYTTNSDNVLRIYREMENCMKGGCGGDGPENNFEAVQKGLNTYKNANKVILLCDNWAVPRDTVLLKGIAQPLEFIMCGAKLGVNSRYIDLARQNGGRITTIEQSTTDLSEMASGEIVKVGREKYKLRYGRFIKI